MGSYDEYGNYIVDDDDYSTSNNTNQQHNADNFSIQSYLNKKKKQSVTNKLLDELKKQDKGYRKVKRLVNGETRDVEFYSTSIEPGTYIRDAVTGSRYTNYRVGSSDETLFFKVRVAEGGSEYKNEPITLFFDDPETYERILGASVKPQEKENWLNKRAAIIVARS